MSLLKQIKVEVPKEYKEAIQFINDFDYEPILKKVSKNLHSPTNRKEMHGSGDGINLSGFIRNVLNVGHAGQCAEI